MFCSTAAYRHLLYPQNTALMAFKCWVLAGRQCCPFCQIWAEASIYISNNIWHWYVFVFAENSKLSIEKFYRLIIGFYYYTFAPLLFRSNQWISRIFYYTANLKAFPACIVLSRRLTIGLFELVLRYETMIMRLGIVYKYDKIRTWGQQRNQPK